MLVLCGFYFLFLGVFVRWMLRPTNFVWDGSSSPEQDD
jgi:hypothetical protein